VSFVSDDSFASKLRALLYEPDEKEKFGVNLTEYLANFYPDRIIDVLISNYTETFPPFEPEYLNNRTVLALLGILIGTFIFLWALFVFLCAGVEDHQDSTSSGQECLKHCCALGYVQTCGCGKTEFETGERNGRESKDHKLLRHKLGVKDSLSRCCYMCWTCDRDLNFVDGGVQSFATQDQSKKKAKIERIINTDRRQTTDDRRGRQGYFKSVAGDNRQRKQSKAPKKQARRPTYADEKAREIEGLVI